MSDSGAADAASLTPGGHASIDWPLRRGVPWWAVMAATLGPAAAVTAWAAAGLVMHVTNYNMLNVTVSDLAGRGVPDRWIMTSGMVAVGVAYIVTALGLRPVRVLGRLALAAGGGGILGVAALPVLPHAPTVPHTLVASFAFAALAVWPVLGSSRQHRSPFGLRWSMPVTIVLLSLLGWHAGEANGGAYPGLSELILAAAQLAWPAAAVITVKVRVLLGRRQRDGSVHRSSAPSSA